MFLDYSIIEIIRLLIHYSFHLVLPALIARVFFKNHWKKAYFIMLATMLIDIDHLIANPIFDPNRCSIGFHPLHSYYAIAVYVVLFFIPKVRVVAIGLLLHIATDFLDCLWL